MIAIILGVVAAQGADIGRQAPEEDTTLDGIPSTEVREGLCKTASSRLQAQFNTCYNLFPKVAADTATADSKANDFINCICSSDWRAGSPLIRDASVYWCETPQSITKGAQALIAASCTPQSTPNEKRGIIKAFRLESKVNGQSYIPQNGFSTSSAIHVAALAMYISLFTL
jgi:hypothetical protein